MGGDLGVFFISQAGYAAINALPDISSCTQSHIFVAHFCHPFCWPQSDWMPGPLA
jgi:hypothetical protein